jgi:hypothetical protein
MKIKIIISIILVSVFVFSSCKKKTVEPISNETPKGVLMMHLHTHISDTEVDYYDTIYTNQDGRKISLKLSQMYVSDIQLVKLDGSIFKVADKNFLKVFETEGYKLENIPVGNYKAIRFKVGLNSTINAIEPTNSSYSSLLNKSEMWFTNPFQSNGYVFANIKGKIDTTVAKNGPLIPFSYKIGTVANLVEVALPDKNFTVSEGMLAYSHLIIDYSKVFEGIELNQVNNLTINSISDNSTSLAKTIKNNISLMFHFE